jgi:hypothetical protein
MIPKDKPKIKLRLAKSSSKTEHRIERMSHIDILLGSEAKGTDKSPFCALMQCIQLCGDAALHLLSRGVTRADCVVPGVVSCGDCLQVCAVYLMPDSFPVITWLSPPLMIARLEDRIDLARWALCLADFAGKTIDLLDGPKVIQAIEKVKIQLSPKLFFKAVRETAVPKCLEPVDLNQEGSTAHSALNLLMRVYQQLVDVEGAHRYILFPIGVIGNPSTRADEYSQEIRLAIEACQSKYFGSGELDEFRPCVVYDLLSKEDGWSTDRPPANLVSLYLDQLRRAVEVLNTAGVAHLDLLPANVIWRATNNSHGEETLELRLLDFEQSALFGMAVTEVDVLKADDRYPVLSTDTRSFIPGCAAHNLWFLRAITGWLSANCDDGTIKFDEYMRVNGAIFEAEFHGELSPPPTHA